MGFSVGTSNRILQRQLPNQNLTVQSTKIDQAQTLKALSISEKTNLSSSTTPSVIKLEKKEDFHLQQNGNSKLKNSEENLEKFTENAEFSINGKTVNIENISLKELKNFRHNDFFDSESFPTENPQINQKRENSNNKINLNLSNKSEIKENIKSDEKRDVSILIDEQEISNLESHHQIKQNKQSFIDSIGFSIDGKIVKLADMTYKELERHAHKAGFTSGNHYAVHPNSNHKIGDKITVNGKELTIRHMNDEEMLFFEKLIHKLIEEKRSNENNKKKEEEELIHAKILQATLAPKKMNPDNKNEKENGNKEEIKKVSLFVLTSAGDIQEDIKKEDNIKKIEQNSAKALKIWETKIDKTEIESSINLHNRKVQLLGLK